MSNRRIAKSKRRSEKKVSAPSPRLQSRGDPAILTTAWPFAADRENQWRTS